MRKIVALIVMAAAVTTAACNTIEGVGKDVKAAGAAVEGAAKESKK